MNKVRSPIEPMFKDPPLRKDLQAVVERLARTSASWEEWEAAIRDSLDKDYPGLTYALKAGVSCMALHYEPSWPGEIEWRDSGPCPKCHGSALMGDDIDDIDVLEGLEPGSPCPECNVAGREPGRAPKDHIWDHIYVAAKRWIMDPEMEPPGPPGSCLLDEEFDFS